MLLWQLILFLMRKASRPSVCNAIETVLVHKNIAERALPIIENRLKEKQVEIRGCQTVCSILSDAVPATEQDWETEYLGYTVAIRVVDDIHQAIDHIMTYTTGHSECIVTESYANAMLFTSQIDAAAVYVNASTRFYRWWYVWARCRNWHFYSKTPCKRSYGY